MYDASKEYVSIVEENESNISQFEITNTETKDRKSVV